MALAAREIELPTGVTLRYVTQGDPTGIPVLFLHGLSDSWRSFEPILPRLPDSMYAFAFSWRGHGESERPDKGYGVEDFEADLEAFMDALRLDSAVLVGHSSPGSTTAQRFAIDHPERTLGLVLAGGFADMTTNAAVRQFWESEVSQLEDPIDEGFVREFQTSVKPVPPTHFETVIKESSKVPARVWKQVVSACLRNNIVDDVHKISVPTLLLWGDEDDFVPREGQEELQAAIPEARLAVYEDTGHNLHWEDPDRYSSDIAEFLDKHIAPRLRGRSGSAASPPPTPQG